MMGLILEKCKAWEGAVTERDQVLEAINNNPAAELKPRARQKIIDNVCLMEEKARKELLSEIRNYKKENPERGL